MKMIEMTRTTKRRHSLTLPLALEARNFTTSYLLEAAAWCKGVQPSPSRAVTSSGRGSSNDTRDVLPLVAARCNRVLNRSFLRRDKSRKTTRKDGTETTRSRQRWMDKERVRKRRKG